MNNEKINMIKLNRDKLTKENRYGIIEFSIDFLFDLNLLKDYIIPLGVSISKGEGNYERYELFCLSPHFDIVENIISSQDAPHYEALVHMSDKRPNMHKAEFRKIKKEIE